jgi:hypothetical protein
MPLERREAALLRLHALLPLDGIEAIAVETIQALLDTHQYDLVDEEIEALTQRRALRKSNRLDLRCTGSDCSGSE